jgi:predicted dehydrogenase|tara:strand:+ start:96 stop:1103 length:1008 start_codon:yes stop_codon:yes gene_type:complete
MNILIVGLGSIGQRHLRNIKRLYPNTNFFSYRRLFKSPSLDNNNRIKDFNLKTKYKIKYINSLNNLEKHKIDIAFICTPSSFHVEETIKIIKQNINIFVEKPLGSSLKNIDKLKKTLKSKKVISMVGFQLRFNPIILKLKKIINSNKFGKLNHILIHHAENINNFHKYENYKDLYAAKKNLGGGVVLTQIHEIDYMLYLLDNYKIKKIRSLSSKVSQLKLDVEDTLNSFFLFVDKKKEVICNLHLNYYEQPGKRQISLIFENSKILADLNNRKITYEKNSHKKVEKFNFTRNDLFMSEIKYFFKHIKKDKRINDSMNLFNGIKTLKLAMRLKKNK